ncbi:MAG TPA: Xaa-Pro dipeptidyl-peptidase [Pirellulaceae bacterium]|nr:Xaa-Pro dipeptidyl-peptidase [Pirellulaceae bacterium]HMO91008.1 Xaa-Pro dipeptidyl-peptidase [Pirellulaceae bacterium]HMP68123.1 Xaa-Pro dipeptidyl-peptidase [Pirellulaceae bacterium]
MPKRFSPVRICALGLAIVSIASFSAIAQTDAPTQEKSVPIFKDGQAQPVPGFSKPSEWIRHDLFVETEFDSDGDGKLDRVHVYVVRPKQTDSEGLKLPAIYVTSPYFSGVGSTRSEYFWNPQHELGETPPERGEMPAIPHSKARPGLNDSHTDQWLPRGYILVYSASPGTGLSQGCPTCGGDNEALAPKAVVDWLNGRARGYTEADGGELVEATWCTGKVGMTGTSYNGTLPIAAATTGVEGLEAIIPIAPNTSYYHYYRSHGLIRHPGGYMGEDIDVLYDFINSGDPDKRAYCNEEIRTKEMQGNFDRITGDYNEFWAGRDYLNKLADYRTPTLMAHAFNDWNVMPEHSVRIYQALKEKGVPSQIFFHQGGHGGPPPFDMMNRWFTRYLHGVENGVEEDPKSWIVRESDRQDQPTAYPDYPHPDASLVSLYLGKGGNESGTLHLTSQPDQGQEKLIDDVNQSGAALATASESANRLLYVTPGLTGDLHLSGTAQLTIRLASDKPAANLSVWLVSLPYTRSRRITDNIITRGWADPQNHKSLTESEPLVPGQFYEFSFDLQPDDQVIPAGQRIGLMIFSSDRDFTLWPAPGTELTLDLDATRIDLPIVGGRAAFEKATK